MVSSKNTVVEHLPHHPKVNGLSQAVAAGSGKDKMGRGKLQPQQLVVIAQW